MGNRSELATREQSLRVFQCGELVFEVLPTQAEQTWTWMASATTSVPTLMIRKR
jgi:hypothetical protein